MQIRTASSPCRPFALVVTILLVLVAFAYAMTADHRAEKAEKAREAAAAKKYEAERAKALAARQKAREAAADHILAGTVVSTAKAGKAPGLIARTKAKLHR